MTETNAPTNSNTDSAPATKPTAPAIKPIEYGGPAGLEPTRYGDWDVRGRCSDF